MSENGAVTTEDRPRSAIGHNNPPGDVILEDDPGLADDFIDTGPIAQRAYRLNAGLVTAFHDAIRTHGPAATRQSAISRMLDRARAMRELPHHAYRVLEQIASRCRWKYRYHCEPLEAVAFFTGASDGGNMKRPVDKLVQLGLVHRLNVPRLSGGRPVPYFTVVCTAEDRSGQTYLDLLRLAKEQYVPCEELISDSSDPNPHCDGLRSFVAKVSPPKNGHPILHGEGLQTLMASGSNLHSEGHNVKDNAEKETEVPLTP